MKKILKRILIGIACTTAAVFAFFFGLGYYIVHYEMNKEPQEEYVCIGQHVYTHAPALMVDSLFDSLNLSGKGIRIGVLDAGFGTFRQRAWTRHLNVAAYADFVDGDTLDFFDESSTWHGTYACACIGGSRNDTLKGLARNATFYLARVDDEDSELRREEEYKMKGIRWLLEHGVDIITSSVGHTTFDDYEGYAPQTLNGHTSRLSCFVDSVLKAHPDLIFIQAAGNEGRENDPWGYNVFPGDVKEVITVGAVNHEGMRRTDYSSPGWTGTPYLKPDVCAYATPPLEGSSFTTPVITGLCAALLEHRRISRKEMITLLHTSGNNASYPNHEIGYGTPQSRAMSNFLQ